MKISTFCFRHSVMQIAYLGGEKNGRQSIGDSISRGGEMHALLDLLYTVCA
jgi:hypothetical protein